MKKKDTQKNHLYRLCCLFRLSKKWIESVDMVTEHLLILEKIWICRHKHFMITTMWTLQEESHRDFGWMDQLSKRISLVIEIPRLVTWCLRHVAAPLVMPPGLVTQQTLNSLALRVKGRPAIILWWLQPIQCHYRPPKWAAQSKVHLYLNSLM